MGSHIVKFSANLFLHGYSSPRLLRHTGATLKLCLFKVTELVIKTLIMGQSIL